jgi:hypothetical protein
MIGRPEKDKINIIKIKGGSNMSKTNLEEIKWVVQIGPDVQGTNFGYVNSNAAQFYLELGTGDPGTTYAWYSTDATEPSNPIPNDKLIEVSGDNTVAWLYKAPEGVSFKFVMTPL